MKYAAILAMCVTLFVAAGHARTVYVATTGNDTTGTGSIDLPYKTIPKAVTVTVVGDSILVRGGHYHYSTTITLSRVGNANARCYLMAYPGERAFLDFSAMAIGSSNRGLRISGSYWYVKGFDVWKAGDNGCYITGANNVVEFCSFSENADTGLQISGAGANNQIINCDSYSNADVAQGNADGFSPKLDVGTGNYFYGCRAWQNSDDGWDGYIRPRPAVTPVTTIENCWCFMNGYLSSGLPSVGNGNGYKMGGSDSANLSHTMILKNCLAFQNRVKGFDQNNNRGNMTLFNCTSYSNGTNYGMNGGILAGSVMTVENCVSAGTGAANILGTAIQATNSWLAPFGVTDSDFVSIDTTGMRGPRNADGSLPTITFMHLAPGSDLIDHGTEVGLPFNGAAPDLGCFESGTTSVAEELNLPRDLILEQNFPNPFNPSTVIQFSIVRQERVALAVYDVLGRQVATLVDGIQQPGIHKVQFSGRGLSSGVYLYRLDVGGRSLTRTLLLLK